MSNCLIFESHATRFAFEANHVASIIWLPEISPVEGMPDWIIGVFNWHGVVVPTIDLGLMFGHHSRLYTISSNVIIIENAGRLLGVISDVMDGLVSVDTRSISSVNPLGEMRSPILKDLLIGEVRLGDEVLALLDAPAFFKIHQLPETISESSTNIPLGFKDFSATQLELLRMRMHQFAVPKEAVVQNF
jgi:chemotaxis signal transduction protein